MQFSFFIFPPLRLVIVRNALALTYFHFMLLLHADCIRNRLRRIDYRLNHRIQEADMDFRGLPLVKYSILAL